MKKSKWLIILVGALLLIIVCVWIYSSRASSLPINIDPNLYYPVTYVVDGDTFKAHVDGRDITVRLLGINTPETVDPRKPVECYGPEASAEAKSLLIGKKVELIFNPDREAHDKYGRYLLFAYRDDGLFVNDFLIREGYAYEYTVGTPYRFQKQFRDIEKQAKEAEKGLWGKCSISPSGTSRYLPKL